MAKKNKNAMSVKTIASVTSINIFRKCALSIVLWSVTLAIILTVELLSLVLPFKKVLLELSQCS